MSMSPWRALSVVTAAVLFAGAPSATAAIQPSPGPSTAAGSCTGSVPFVSGTAGYDTFRIPAVVRARDGALLAFAEGRKDSTSDAGKIDTVLRRSADGGCTWGELSVTTVNGTDGTAGNPSPVVLPTGRIVLLTTHNAGYATEEQILTGAVPAEDSRRVFAQYSDNDGRSWSPARDITAQTKRADWRWYATGPGHAIVLSGRYAGRIVVACDHSSAPPPGSADTGAESKYYGNHDLYSDDGGRSWRIGYTDDRADGYIEANENTAAQLPDGLVYFNSRDAGTAPGTRVDGYSRDGGRTLVAPLRPEPAIAGPVVEGSVLQTSDPHVLVYSGPSDPDSRKAMQLRISNDGGRTWHAGRTVTTAFAAYSDLVQLDRRTLGLLYETGTTSSSDTIAFQRIPQAQVGS